MPRIHVTGASGAGTTTLARALAGKLRIPHIDSDSYYWIPTVPPFRLKQDRKLRDRRLREDLAALDGWAWSGSAVGWDHGGDERMQLCVFLTVPPEIRMARLREREEFYFRDLPYVAREEWVDEMRDFLAWAARYEEGGLDVRSRKFHEKWLATLTCPVLRIDGDTTTEERVAQVLRMLQELNIEQSPNADPR